MADATAAPAPAYLICRAICGVPVSKCKCDSECVRVRHGTNKLLRGSVTWRRHCCDGRWHWIWPAVSTKICVLVTVTHPDRSSCTETCSVCWFCWRSCACCPSRSPVTDVSFSHTAPGPASARRRNPPALSPPGCPECTFTWERPSGGSQLLPPGRRTAQFGSL